MRGRQGEGDRYCIGRSDQGMERHHTRPWLKLRSLNRGDGRAEMMPGRRSLDVSPESSMQKLGKFRPFSEDDVYEILSRRTGHDQIDYVVPE